MRAWIATALTLLVSVSWADEDWQALGPWGGPLLAIEIPDRAGQRVYALTNTSVLRSDDRGATWTAISLHPGDDTFVSAAQLATTPADPNRLIWMDTSTAHLSDDGGATWREIKRADDEPGLEGRLTAVALHPTNRDRLVLMETIAWTIVKRWTSSDGGASFESLQFDSPECPYLYPTISRVYAVEYDPQNPERLIYAQALQCDSQPVWDDYHLVRASDGAFGAFFSGLNSQVPYDVTGEIVSDAANIYVRTRRSLQRIARADSSRTGLDEAVADVTVEGEGHLLMAHATGIYRSTNAGSNWSPVSNESFGLGPNYPSVPARQVASFEAPVRRLATNYDGVFRQDGGEGAWQFSSAGYSAVPLRAVIVDPTDDRRFWLGMSESLFPASSRRILYRTSDGGDSWQYSNLPTFAKSLRRLALDPATLGGAGTGTLYGAGLGCWSGGCEPGMSDNYGLFKSVDGGASWLPLTHGLGPLEAQGGRSMRAIVLDETTGTPATRRLYATHSQQNFGGLLARSENSGQAWSNSSSGLPMFGNGETSDAFDIALAPSQSSRMYLATYGYRTSEPIQAPVQPAGVFRSDDAGTTWTHRSNGLPRYAPDAAHTGVWSLAVHPSNPDMVWAVTYEWVDATSTYADRVFKSVDGGLNWSESSTGLPRTGWFDIAVDPQRSSHLYVAGIPGVYVSSDGGGTWQPLGSALLVDKFALAVTPQHVFAVGNDGAHRIVKLGEQDPVFCSGFENPGIRALRAGCTGRAPWFRQD